MKIFSLLVTLLIATSCGHRDKVAGEPRLIGCWMSDGPGTMKYIRENRNLSEDKLEHYEHLFGKIKVTNTGTHSIFEINGHKLEQPIVILGSDHDSVALKGLDGNTNEYEICIITFDSDGNGYWVFNPEYDMKEHFIRCKSAE